MKILKMSKYFFDTYALIELIKGNPNYEFIKDNVIITSPMNIAELYYSLLLENNKEFADKIINSFNFELIEITSKIAIKSSLFRFQNKKLKLSYIDCMGYILALKNNLLFLTGDKGFENLENVEYVKKE
jgi:predicted nucleic acid-binding protein